MKQKTTILVNPEKRQTLLECKKSILKQKADAFVEKIGPYIIESFAYRIPSGRSTSSKFGTMTQAKRDALIGSAYKQNLEDLIVNYKAKYTTKD